MEDFKTNNVENPFDNAYDEQSEMLEEGARQMEDKDVELDLMCKRIAYWNFKLVPMFEKVQSTELINTSSDIRNGIKILCVETPIVNNVYGKAIFQLSDKGINNYFIAYIAKEVEPTTVNSVQCNVR